jgi:hypothetical protein
MGLLDLFKKKPKFVDELFGELRYIKLKDPSKNYYEGEITFDSQQCGILLDGDENGPTKEQKQFFSKLSEKFPSLKNDVIVPFLNGELKDWIENSPIVDFDKEFELDSITLPVINEKQVIWSLTLYSTSIEHYITIEFTEWQPNFGVSVDG